VALEPKHAALANLRYAASYGKKRTAAHATLHDSGILAVRGRSALEGHALMIPRDQVAAIMVGSGFLFIGLAACGIAAIRGRGGARILVRQGILSALYGAHKLAEQGVAVDTHFFLAETTTFCGTSRSPQSLAHVF
jgi:hypothetical protein